MAARTRRNIPEERYTAIERAVREYCENTVQGTQSNYVKPKRIKKKISDVFSDEITSARVRGWLVGSVLQDAEYADQWSKETYYIDGSYF